ncbi:DUF1552 domain-containing protein [Fuerstiella marisgermanici]|uniref:DUF1552 domain-containing protein n=1 Tax=Fuerstiella marisgermanici TaxID=1891926 RepID=A0A1P8WPS2_9PLAN|nr:DUF1552 domain-containing protein [Fuerstiella marisgermanici]APZ96048.1 hypothetical protein Fuma_05711 [Fuerstiella marisgermanici]
MNTTRRTFLRGLGGTALSLLWLESLNAGTSGKTIPQRLAFYYVPIGVVRRGFFPGEGEAAIPKFTSSQEEIKTKAKIPLGLQPLNLTPTMQPLDAVKDKVTLITGMDRTFQQGTDVHAQCASCYLSSAPPFSVKESAWPLSRTLDHLVADHVGKATPFPTLEFSCNSHRDNKESIYFDNISWYGTGHVAPSIRDPRKMYRRLFSTQDIDRYRNITDLVLEDARSMTHTLGRSDREKFAEYFDSVRTIEQQMDKLEKMKSELATVRFEEPTEAHLPRGEYIRLMGDLMVVALQTGMTNVATFMVGPERWDTPFLYESLFDKPRSHHQMSHNQKKFLDELLQVDLFHMQQFAYLVQKMDQIEEADGTSLLDNTLFTYGSGLGDGATHQYTDLPTIIAGSGGGKIKTGKHLNVADGTPLANLWLTQAQVMGLNMKRFADSTDVVDSLLV